MGYVPVQERLRLLAGQVFAAAELGMWCYGFDGEFFYSTCPYEKDFQLFLKVSGCLDFALEKENGIRKPLFLSSEIGLMWIAEHMYEDGKPSLLILMGPFFPSKTSKNSIENSLRKMQLDLSVRLQMMRIMENVPYISLRMANQYAAMLHYMLTEETLSKTEFEVQYPGLRTEIQTEEEKPYQEQADVERILQGEAVLLQCVQDGDLNYQAVMGNAESVTSLLLSSSGNVLRDGKNSLLIFISQCCRAAIRGGLPARTAKELEADYLNRVENCRTVTELMKLNTGMLEDYVHRVHALRESPYVSSAIRRASDFIRANILREFSLEDVAREVGYTDYYFAKKFAREMGVKVNDYIKEVRIDYARILLVTTDRSIQDISDSLHFGNRNYFSKVFREVTGLAPAAYREQIRKDGRYDNFTERKD